MIKKGRVFKITCFVVLFCFFQGCSYTETSFDDFQYLDNIDYENDSFYSYGYVKDNNNTILFVQIVDERIEESIKQEETPIDLQFNIEHTVLKAVCRNDYLFELINDKEHSVSVDFFLGYDGIPYMQTYISSCD